MSCVKKRFSQTAICSEVLAGCIFLLAFSMLTLVVMPATIHAEGGGEIAIDQTPLVPATLRSEVLKMRVVEKPIISEKKFSYCATIPLLRGPKNHYFNALTRRVNQLSGASMTPRFALQYFALKLVNAEDIPDIGVEEEFIQRLAKEAVAIGFEERVARLGDVEPDSPLSLHVFAQSASDAIQAAKFFVYLVETTTLQRTNRSFAEAHAENLKRIGEISEQLEESQKELAALPESTEDYGSGELDAMKERSRFLLVDRSGLEARIDACRRISQKEQGGNTHISSLRVNAAEKLLVEAEIQLIGVVAELKEAKDFVNEIESEVAARQKRDILILNSDTLRQSLNSLRKETHRYEREFGRSLPLDVIDNTVIVQEVK